MSQEVIVQVVTGTQGPPGAAGANGANGAAGTGGNASGVSLFEDFLGEPITVGSVVSYGGCFPLAGALAGGVGKAINKSFFGPLDGHPGIIGLTSGAAGDGSVSLFGAESPQSAAFAAGDGEITWEMLATFTAVNNPAVQRYHTQFGMSTTTDGTVDGDGLAWFEYGQELDDSGEVNSGKFLCHALGETLDSGITPTAFGTTWHKFKIVVAADASEAEFFIDEVSVGTITTDLSSVVATVMANLTKVSGTTPRALYIDYLSLVLSLTTPR